MEMTDKDENYIAISLISLSQSYFLESRGSGHIVGKFLKLFSHEYDKESKTYVIEGLQQNSHELRLSVNHFITSSRDLPSNMNIIRKFLSELPDNHYFAMVVGKVTDTSIIMQYFDFLEKLHLEKGLIGSANNRSFKWVGIYAHYNLQSFGHQRRKIAAGGDKVNRICRFCNTKNGDVNIFGETVFFRKRSHSFSEALGNKLVSTMDECDSCNERFGKTIERSLITYLSLFRSLHGLKGKNGTKKLVGENFTLDPVLGLDVLYDGTIDITSKINTFESILNLRETFIPQDLYRALVKFVLSVIDQKDMSRYKKTIEWINGEFNCSQLPSIAQTQSNAFFNEKPSLHYFERKDDFLTAYLIGEFHYADLVFLFIVPFCETNEETYVHSTDYEEFWKEFNQNRSMYEWHLKDLSSTDPMKIQINMNIDGIIIGENASVRQITDDPVN
jgi:hypothetical protein